VKFVFTFTFVTPCRP